MLIHEASSSRWGNDLPQISGWLVAAGPVLTPKWNSCLICFLNICSTTEQTSLMPLMLSVSDTYFYVIVLVTICLIYVESLPYAKQMN